MTWGAESISMMMLVHHHDDDDDDDDDDDEGSHGLDDLIALKMLRWAKSKFIPSASHSR